MSTYRIRAVARADHPGFYRNKFYYAAGDWTERELTTAEAAALMKEPRLIVELGEKPKNQATAQNELVKLHDALEAEKKAHEGTKAELKAARAEIDKLTAPALEFAKK